MEIDRFVVVDQAVAHETSWDYDDADRIDHTYLPGGAEIGFDYDPSGNMTLLTMPSGADHQLGYTPPGNADYQWGYDLDRDLEIHTLPGGRTLAVSHETQEGRLLGLDYDEAEVSLSYADATTRCSDITRTPIIGGDPQTIGLLWDGPLITEIAYSGPTEGTFGYTYDDNFELTEIALTSGVDSITIPVQHDDDGLTTQIGPFTFSRNGPVGLMDGIDDGVLDVDIEYDYLGREVTRAHLVAGFEVYRIELEFDASGRISRKTETVDGTERVRDYTYDDDGQLFEVLLDGVLSEAYTYDDNGNRDSTLAVTASYDVQDILIVVGGVAYTFDDDGFLVQRGSDLFEYSVRGELLQATVSGDTVTYDYDGFARRLARTDDSGTLKYLYGDLDAPFRVTATRDPDGVLTTYRYDDRGRLLALERGEPWYQAVVLRGHRPGGHTPGGD